METDFQKKKCKAFQFQVTNYLKMGQIDSENVNIDYLRTIFMKKENVLIWTTISMGLHGVQWWTPQVLNILLRFIAWESKYDFC